MWIQENRNSITHLDEFGIRGVSLRPNAIIPMVDTPAIRKAIEAKAVKEVFPIWSEDRKTVICYTDNVPIVHPITTIDDEGCEE